MTSLLPALRLAEWQATRDSLHQIMKILGRMRGTHTPKAKHWWHITLTVSARGLTTTPFPISGQQLELILDLATHRLVMESGEGWSASLPLVGQSTGGMSRRIAEVLASRGIELSNDVLRMFDGEETLEYDAAAVSRYHRAISWIDMVLKTFKGGLREETSPVQLFPHHMDLAMNWFSGRLVPGVDPADEENADEQMNFGFVTGDGSVSDAYFYTTAYPAPDNWTDLELTGEAYWHTEGWTGALLPYSALLISDHPQQRLLDYLQALQAHGQRLMAP
jgi:hypothetical protein